MLNFLHFFLLIDGGRDKYIGIDQTIFTREIHHKIVSQMEGIVEENVTQTTDIEMVEKSATEEEFYEDGIDSNFDSATAAAATTTAATTVADGGASTAVTIAGGTTSNGDLEEGFDYSRTSPGRGGFR